MTNDLILLDKQFTDEEFRIIKTPKSLPIKNYSKQACNDLLNISGLDNEYRVYVADSATYLIKEVFKNNCDDDTLVVISYKEHTAVKTEAYKSKNLLVLTKEDIQEFNTTKIIETFNKSNLSKIFIALIGTGFTDGTWIPDTYFIKLKSDLSGVPHKIMIDDCQSMFLINHNYKLFDYVITTCHALVKEFDMGVLFTRTDESYGIDAYNWVGEYLNRLGLLIPKLKDNTLYYKTRMKDIFQFLLSKNLIEIIDSVPHIFAIKVHKKCDFTSEEIKKLDSLHIQIFDNFHENDFIIRFRLADSMQDTNFKESILYCYDLLTRNNDLLTYNKRRINGN